MRILIREREEGIMATVEGRDDRCEFEILRRQAWWGVNWDMRFSNIYYKNIFLAKLPGNTSSNKLIKAIIQFARSSLNNGNPKAIGCPTKDASKRLKYNQLFLTDLAIVLSGEGKNYSMISFPLHTFLIVM